jgi:hypothetical protein
MIHYYALVILGIAIAVVIKVVFINHALIREVCNAKKVFY